MEVGRAEHEILKLTAIFPPAKVFPSFYSVPADSGSVCTQSCPTLMTPWTVACPWDFPGEIWEWVAISSSKWPSRPRDQTYVSCVSSIAGRFFTIEPPGKPMHLQRDSQIWKEFWYQFSMQMTRVQRKVLHKENNITPGRIQT